MAKTERLYAKTSARIKRMWALLAEDMGESKGRVLEILIEREYVRRRLDEKENQGKNDSKQ